MQYKAPHNFGDIGATLRAIHNNQFAVKLAATAIQQSVSMWLFNKPKTDLFLGNHSNLVVYAAECWSDTGSTIP